MALSCDMEEAMAMLTAEAASSSSRPWLKRHRRCVNHDREATHLRLHHDYFNDDCVYPLVLLLKVPYVNESFSKHYVQA
jgi:hypothetical protein